MNVNKSDINNPASAEIAPGFRDPLLLNEPIEQDMQMRDTTLVKFQDGDELDRAAVFPEQINTKLSEDAPQIPNWVALDLGGVERES